MPFVINTHLLGIKKETTPYTKESLVASDFNIRFYDVEFNTDVSNHAVKALLGNMMTIPDVKGKASGTCTFSFDLTPKAIGSEATPPAWSKILTSCGANETIYAGVGVGYTQGINSLCSPVTIEYRDLTCDNNTQKIQSISGATGNIVITLDENNGRLKGVCTFVGALEDESEATGVSIITGITTTDTEAPESFSAYSMTFGGDSRVVDGFEFDFGNTNNLIADNENASGHRGSFIGDQEPKVTTAPLMQTNSEEANLKIFESYKKGLTGALSIAHTSSTTLSPVTFTFPVAQVETANNGDRENLRTREVVFKVLDADTLDAWEILQGAKV